MQVQIAGKRIDVGEALRERIAYGLEDRVSKYFDRTGEAFVTVSKPGWAFNVDCSIHLPSGVTLQAHGEAEDAYQAFEDSLEKIEKRVRRYKRRLKDHHKNKDAIPAIEVQEQIIAPYDDNEDDDEGASQPLANGELGDAPAIIAESGARIKTMTVSMAVMQLELTDTCAILFRNAKDGDLNMVYRRADGNIGWVDPGRSG